MADKVQATKDEEIHPCIGCNASTCELCNKLEERKVCLPSSILEELYG